MDVAATVAWEMGAEVVVTATDFGVHEAETRRILSTTPLTSGVTRLHLDAPLTFQHFSGEESHGTAGRSIEMRAKVGLLTRNVVIRGEGEGETLPYTQWNSAAGGAPAGAGDCGNGTPSPPCVTCVRLQEGLFFPSKKIADHPPCLS